MSFAPEDNNLAYTIAGIGRKRDPYADRRTFAQRLIAQGTDTSPIQSPWQGVARLAQAVMGGFDSYAADRDEKKATEDRNTKLAAVMAEPDPTKRIGLINALDPELGVRLSGQMALDQAKAKAQREGLQTAAGSFGSSYGMSSAPPSGGYQGTLGGFESGNNPRAVNPQSGAGGEFQFMPQTWAEVRAKHPDLQLPETPMQASPQQQAAAEARFRDSNARTLQGAGIPPTPANLYLAHRAGAQGAQTLLKADPNAPMAAVVPPAWIAQNPDMQGKTVGQFVQMAQQRFPGGGQPAQSVNVQATPPGGGGQPLTINMPGPGGMPQGSADGRPPAPSPQGLPSPVMTAQAPPQAPAIPDVPRPRPTPQMIEQYQQRFASGEFGDDPRVALPRARAALEAEIDRDWSVLRDRAKMQFGQQTTDYADQRRAQREAEKDERTRNLPSRTELEKLHTARTEAVTIASSLNDFQREFQNTGTWGALKSVVGATTPVNTAYNAAALMAKGEALFNLGVLNGPDLEIIRRTLPDPSTPKGAMTSNQDMSAAVGKVIDLLQTRLASREKQLGLPVTDVRGAANDLRATMPGGPTQQPTGGPIAPGAIEDGYRFRGGNPADKNNWERVQ
jgi:hypothetical protein